MLANKPYLRQEDVQKILDAANAHAEKHDWAVTIAVCDDGGHLLGLIRRDDCAPVSSYIAQDKARASAMGKRECSRLPCAGLSSPHHITAFQNNWNGFGLDGGGLGITLLSYRLENLGV